MSEGENPSGNGHVLPPPPAGPVRSELARATPDDPVFLERVMRYLEDDLSKQEVLALGRQLALDSAKRDTFVLLTLSDAVSNSELGSGGIVLPGSEAGPIDLDDPSIMLDRAAMVLSAQRVRALTSRVTIPQSRASRRRWHWFGLPCIGLLILIACGVLAWRFRLHPAGPLSQGPPIIAPAPRVASATAPSPPPGTLLVATLAEGHRLRWSGPPVDPGSRLSNDIALNVLDGLALVTYPHGTRIILQGPCEFAVHDSSSAMLYSGRLTAQIPPQVSFTVSAGKTSFTSTGGTFGMTVTGNGVTEAHVLDGSLTAATNDGQSRAPSTLGPGLAARSQTSGGSFMTLVASPAEFVTTWPAAPATARLPSVITRQEGDRYFDNNDFRNAMLVYSELLRRNPSQLPLVAHRLGALYVWSGDFETAAHQFELAAAPADSDISFLYRAGCLRAVIGNGPSYRDDCRLLLSRCRGSTRRNHLELTAKTCMLYPDSVDDMSAVYRMAARAPLGEKSEDWLRWFQLTAAFAEYRQGHDQAALDVLRKIADKFSYTERHAVTLLEAACEFRLKLPTTAATLAKARADSDMANLGPVPSPKGAVENWCVNKVLESEVRAMVGPAMWAAAAPPPPPDPIAAYDFDNSARTLVADSSQYPPANGTVHGKVNRILGPAGIGYAMEFDGEDSWVEIGNPPKLNFDGAITITAWIRCDDLSGEFRSIVEHGPAAALGATETGLRIRRGAYEVGSRARNTDYRTQSTAGDMGNWTFIAGVYDGKYWRLYRDGAQVAESAAPIGAVKVADNWFIGACADRKSRSAFKGAIAAVRIFNAALSGDQLATVGKLGQAR